MRGLYSLMLYTSFTSTASYGTSRELPAPCERGALLRQRLLALSLYRVAVKLQDLQNAHCIPVAAEQLLWQADVRLLWDISDATSGSGCHSGLNFQLLCPTKAGLLGFAGPGHTTQRGQGMAPRRSASARQGASRAAVVCGDAPDVLDCTQTSVLAGKGQPCRPPGVRGSTTSAGQTDVELAPRV